MKQLLRRLLLVAALFPLMIGAIGYVTSGEMVTNALYASFALYFTNPISDEYNIYIEIARWTAPLVTATTILCALQSVWESLKYRMTLLGKKDKVAVYSDEECYISFGKGVSSVYPGERFKRYANDHIIMFSTDKKSLRFYEEHREELTGKNVYIGIKDIECGLQKNVNNVTFFNVNTAIARLLWKEIALWDRDMETSDVLIWGDGTLAGDIICIGLQLNLFSLAQKVKYHVITDNELFQRRHSDLKLMNHDQLIFYDKADPGIWNIVSKADIIIIADDLDAELFQTVVVKSGETPLYYYSPDEGDLASYLSFGNLIPFGRKTQVLTDDNIRRKKIIRKAIALNEHYANQYGTKKEWDLLSGFLKSSNISASDFGEVLSALSEKRSEDELIRLEHIRWCRFYYLNYYTFGIPDNEKSRDDKKRIHKDLVDYEELDPAEKVKNAETIRITPNLHE